MLRSHDDFAESVSAPYSVNVDVNTGLIAFATILAFHRISVDPDQLRHAIGHDRPIEADDILRLAKQQKDVRAKRIAADWERLTRTPLPALANGSGGWFIIGRVGVDEILVQRPGQSVQKLDRAGLEQIWSGELILITTREGLAGFAGKFDVRWFIPQIVKYRRLIGEVLLITLAINLLGLAAPLFFQNVIDSRTALPALKGAIKFTGVNFRYGLEGPWTVENIDLDIEAGTSLGIVGSSGSGKSTLTKLLQRLYTPASGRTGRR